MISKLIGIYLLIDGIGSWWIYRKQKLLITKKKIISLCPFLRLKIKKLSGLRVRTVRQSNLEHLSRFIRAGIGLGLLLAPLPF
jgi:hypothetical protein